MKKNKKLLALAIAALSFTPPTFAYTIDGYINDWVAASGSWTPKPGVKAWTQEDQTGSGSFYLNPGYGGQTYDAEAMYIDWDASNLYVAIVTGLSPATSQNPPNSYAAGDILFDFGPDGTYNFGLVTKTRSDKTAGELYGVTSLTYGLWEGPNDPGPPYNYPVAVATGSKIADASIVYEAAKSFTGYGANLSETHYLIEASIPVSAFGAFWSANGPTQSFHAQWGALCANDIIGVDPRAHVPEPGSLLLATLGLGTLAGFQRRRARRA
jgi:hypothetical protein